VAVLVFHFLRIKVPFRVFQVELAVDNVSYVDQFGTSIPKLPISYTRPLLKVHHVREARPLPPLRIGDWIAEEVEEGGLEECVELGECFAAFGTQRIRRIQYPRNPLLLRQRWEGDFEL
jgi:hypothetical protein